MPYHLCEHIYITQFRNELIVLDTKQDKYTICFEQVSRLLLDLVDEKQFNNKSNLFPNLKSQISLSDLACIQQLTDNNIIEEKWIPFPFHIDSKPESNGVSNVDWSLPLENKRISLSFSVLESLITLFKVNFYMKFKGFYSTIQLIKQSRNSQVNYNIPQDEDLKDLATIVNKACLIYPTRTKCLEWAMTFVLLSIKREWKCNLEIGVQNYPFLAHAWVECGEKVVMDSQDLRTGLAIILNEPFRKLKV